MQDLDKTIGGYRPKQQATRGGGQLLTFFDADRTPWQIDLDATGAQRITFGRSDSNDIVLTSQVVSREHGCFVRENGEWRIQDLGSTNGLICNDAMIKSRTLSDGDILRIDEDVRQMTEGVLIVVSSASGSGQWQAVDLAGSVSIGRDPGCTITLPHSSVSRRHAVIRKTGDGWTIEDLGSTNGVLVNGRQIAGSARLHEKDVVTITNSKLIITSGRVYYCCYRGGISVDAHNIVIERGRGKRKFVTCNHVNLHIKPGELVSVIGGSGAGKSTILNALCGYLKPTDGSVYINGVNLYQNFDALKKLVGYVPQSDIVYDNLTLYDMLKYTARLRLPEDTSPAEMEKAIARAIDTVSLSDKKQSLIRSLSGGQRKRASIAVELLSDPNLLFLDEPASGLDPGTERSLMESLRRMADTGKTVILVTHSTLQLKMCDKIVFMGRGGNLCYFGNYNDALEFFGIDDIVDVYNMITDEPKKWRDRYRAIASGGGAPRTNEKVGGKPRKRRFRQLWVLCQRYFKLVFNDRQRLILLLVQAPLLALLISFVADGEEFKQYEMTKSLLFALSCSAFWIGMLNAIQEICKERTILRREYMTGLSLSSYVLSKIAVLGALCLLQSAMVTGVFVGLVGMPEEGLMMPPLLEMYITTALTAIASAAMGLFVSALFTNADRAMTVAPILLMPQILFSGLIFKLSDSTEIISWFAVCRWSMEGYGTTANLNTLDLRLQQQGIQIAHEAEDFFEFTNGHMLKAWGILVAFIAVFLIAARLSLGRIGKENS